MMSLHYANIMMLCNYGMLMSLHCVMSLCYANVIITLCCDIITLW